MFGDNLRELRKEKGLTQLQLAQIIGVGRSTLTSWETNIYQPDLEMLKTIKKVLQVTYEELLDG